MADRQGDGPGEASQPGVKTCKVARGFPQGQVALVPGRRKELPEARALRSVLIWRKSVAEGPSVC